MTAAHIPMAYLVTPGSASPLDQAIKELCKAITGKEKLHGLTHQAFEWQLKYLLDRASEVWSSLIIKVVVGSAPDPCKSKIDSKIALYTVLTRVARCLTDDGEVTLSCMVDQLISDKLIRPERQSLALQLVFQMTGWLTALWDPISYPNDRELCLVGAGTTRKHGLLHNPAIRNIAAPLKDVTYQQIYNLTSRYGKLFPAAEFCLEDKTLGSRDVESACLNTAYLHFHILEDIVGIRLKWTRTLNQHLEYNSQQKELYIFSNPSICLSAYHRNGRGFLSKIFEAQKFGSTDNTRYPALNDMGYEDFLVEVLLSYRLIFGKHQKSRRRVAQLLNENSDKEPGGRRDDPLLKLLCTGDEVSEGLKELNQLLEGEDFGNYVPIAEYPFLATKLIRLQRLSMGRDPHSFRRLWNDRRNPTAWFASRLVLIIGGGSLILALLQLIFQIYQTFAPR